MFNILPIVLILLALGVIIVIVVRKFSVLANMDTDSIPAEREAKVREQIMTNRLRRQLLKVQKQAGKVAMPLVRSAVEMGKNAYQKLLDYKERQKEEEQELVEPEENVLEKKFIEAEEAFKAENYEEAEKKCIDIIGLDAASIKAFRLLGRVYEEKKEYTEAAQTLEHALRLLEKDFKDQMAAGSNPEELNTQIAQLYYDLADIARQSGNDSQVLQNIEAALKIEPKNPRFLDIKLNFSIINKDKIKALEALEVLKEVNPDNQKLSEYETQVKEL